MAAKTAKVLYIGDSETVINRYAVGADVFEQSWFNDNGKYLRIALAGRDDVTVRHIIPANVPAEFRRRPKNCRNTTS